MRLKISGGRLYDPAVGWDGVERHLFIQGDRIVAHLAEVDRVIQAQGQVVTPAGIELRGQVATYGLNLLRLRHGLPSPEELGTTYAALGYTHVHEPFLTLATANYVHRELVALPWVDTSASLAINLRELDIWIKASERWREVGETLLSLLEHTRSLNLRLAEPFVRYRQDFYRHRELDLDPVLEFFTELAHRYQATVILESSPEVLSATFPDYRVFHLSALSNALTKDELMERATDLLDQGISADLGLFDPYRGGDASVDAVLIDLGWYRPLNLCPAPEVGQARRAVHLALQYQGPQLAFSGACLFQAPVQDYPRLFSWLGDRQARLEHWGEDWGARQFSILEWVRATRTLPARILGLADRGHLQPGARADVAIYDLPAKAAVGRWPGPLSRCRTLLKGGEVIIDNFQVAARRAAKATWYRDYGAEAGPMLRELCQYQSFRLENLWVSSDREIAWARV